MAQDSNRDIRNSCMKRISELFSAPPVATGLTAYTVYNEVDLRAAQAGTLTPVRPSVFLVDTDIRPAITALPMIAVEMVVGGKLFELGNDRGLAFEGGLHCFGRQSNEASLLAYTLVRNFKPFVVYDYSNPDSPTVRETALLDPNAFQIMRGPTLGDEERQNGAYGNWFVVSIRGQIKDA